MNQEDVIRARLERAVADKVFPGAVVGVIHKDGTRLLVPHGRFTYEASSREVDVATVYDVASVTKAVPVALTALKLIESGRLRLDDQVIKYIPEITIEHADKGLIRHLLTYTYALRKNTDPNFSYEHSKAKDIFDFLYTRPFEFLPGTQYQYSNTPANLLGIALERITGEKLHALAQETILDALRMNHSTFHPTNARLVPPTEITSWRGEIQGEVHDETAFILEREGFNPGCAGLFSSADDLLNVAEMILNKGSFKGHEIFSPQTISLMTTNALGSIGAWSGIGWEADQPQFMGVHAHEHMIGKTGFTGTSIVIDPRSGTGVVLLSNRTYPKRPSVDTGTTHEVRRDISDIVFRTT